MVLLTVWVVWREKRTEKDEEPRSGQIRLPTPTGGKEKVEIELGYKEVAKEVVWQVEKWPETDRAEVYDLVENEAERTKWAENLSKYLNIDWAKKKKMGETRWLAETSDKKRSLIVNTSMTEIEYGREIGRDDLANLAGLVDREEVEDMIKTMAQAMGITDRWIVKVVDMRPKRMVYPRWVTTNWDLAEAVEVRARLEWENKELLAPMNFPLEMTVLANGTISRLAVNLPEGEPQRAGVRLLKTREKIISEPVVVWKREGGEGFELIDNMAVGKEKLSEVRVVWVMINTERRLVPYFLFEGEAVVNRDQVWEGLYLVRAIDG